MGGGGVNSPITHSDIISECASISGYLECIEDMISSEIVTESILMEGLGAAIIGVIKGLLHKLGELFKRISGFFRNKKMNENKKSHVKFVPVKPQTVEEWIKTHAFSGIDPSGVNIILLDIKTCTNEFIPVSRSLINTSVIDFKNGKPVSLDIEEITGKLCASFYGSSLGTASVNKDGVTLDDVGKVPANIYRMIKESDTKPLTVDKLTDFISEANELPAKYNEITGELTKSTGGLSEYLKNMENAVATKFKMTDDNQKSLKSVQTLLTILIKCTTGYAASLTEVFAKLDKDIANIQTYVNSLQQFNKIEVFKHDSIIRNHHHLRCCYYRRNAYIQHV